MSDFMERLKEVLVDELKDRNLGACAYYETLMQNQGVVQQIEKLLENEEYEIYYEQPEDEDYCSNGDINIYVQDADFGIKINLREDERWLGYCECQPSDEGYDPVRRCCGVSCDWLVPFIIITKTHNLGYFSFNGKARDFWTLQTKWDNKEEEYKDLQKQASLNWIQEQIERLEKQKELLENS